MQFSDATTKQGLLEDITWNLGLDTNAFPNADRTRLINERYRMVLAVILEVCGGWKFQDDNVSALPYADQTITSGTEVYPIPTSSLTINMIQIKNSGGSWQAPLTPITLEQFKQIGGEISMTPTAVPRYYMLYEDSIRLIPPPNYTLASAIRVYFDRDVSTFAATDTTKVPGFAIQFHRMLSVGASLDFAMTKGLNDKVPALQNLWNQYEVQLRKFYSMRFRDMNPPTIGPGMDLMDDLT